jgi:hypothetical protein
MLRLLSPRTGQVAAGSAAGGGQTGASQVTFGPQHRGEMPGLVGVEQGQQVGDRAGVAQFERGADGQRPRPAQVLVADPQDACASERRPGLAQRIGRPAGDRQ